MFGFRWFDSWMKTYVFSFACFLLFSVASVTWADDFAVRFVRGLTDEMNNAFYDLERRYGQDASLLLIAGQFQDNDISAPAAEYVDYLNQAWYPASVEYRRYIQRLVRWQHALKSGAIGDAHVEYILEPRFNIWRKINYMLNAELTHQIFRITQSAAIQHGQANSDCCGDDPQGAHSPGKLFVDEAMAFFDSILGMNLIPEPDKVAKLVGDSPIVPKEILELSGDSLGICSSHAINEETSLTEWIRVNQTTGNGVDSREGKPNETFLEAFHFSKMEDYYQYRNQLFEFTDGELSSLLTEYDGTLEASTETDGELKSQRDAARKLGVSLQELRDMVSQACDDMAAEEKARARAKLPQLVAETPEYVAQRQQCLAEQERFWKIETLSLLSIDATNSWFGPGAKPGRTFARGGIYRPPPVVRHVNAGAGNPPKPLGVKYGPRSNQSKIDAMQAIVVSQKRVGMRRITKSGNVSRAKSTKNNEISTFKGRVFQSPDGKVFTDAKTRFTVDYFSNGHLIGSALTVPLGTGKPPGKATAQTPMEVLWSHGEGGAVTAYRALYPKSDLIRIYAPNVGKKALPMCSGFKKQLVQGGCKQALAAVAKEHNITFEYIYKSGIGYRIDPSGEVSRFHLPCGPRSPFPVAKSPGGESNCPSDRPCLDGLIDPY